MEYRQRLYDAIKAYGGEWVNVIELEKELKLNRSDLNKTARILEGHKDWPGIEISSKRLKDARVFGRPVPKYNIKYRWIENGSTITSNN